MIRPATQSSKLIRKPAKCVSKTPTKRQRVAAALNAKWLCCLGLGTFLLCSGCKSFQTNDVHDRVLPSNFRDWSPEFMRLPKAEFEEDVVKVSNIRNNEYLSNDDYVVNYYDDQFDLKQLETVDFFVVPFEGVEFMAHTMISFGFSDGRYLCVSAEIRTEKGETYSPVAGMTRQYEITYVVADERDLVRLRTSHRDAQVYLYRTVASPEQARMLFRDVMKRVNQLAVKPEFYDTLANNCTTNIVRHVNRIRPNRVPYSFQVLLPGFSDKYAYDLGLIDRSVPFPDLKRAALINDLATKHYYDTDFSNKIRARIDGTNPTGVDPSFEAIPTEPDVNFEEKATVDSNADSDPSVENVGLDDVKAEE